MPDYRSNPAVIETDLGDELILLDPATREMFSLNATGRVVWRALAEGGGRALAIARLTEAFAVDAAQAAVDVDELASRLAAAGLVAGGVTADAAGGDAAG